MALYHFHADLIRRSKGQSVVAAAAYRAGEKLRCDYYGNEADYTRKKGVVLTDILLPPLAPKEYADRETLWNAVEQAEKNAKAQLAYSYDIALQNELSIEENIALARQFLQEQFVSKGMIVDFAVHTPDLESGGIPNPHFHVLCPVRPIDETGKWSAKQRREYVLDEQGQRIRNEAGNYVWNAVPTTDWGEKGTLLHWREEWASYVNRALEQKGLPSRIDHRSYADRGMEETPTVHEGPTVRAMEAKGIQTDVGSLNRWIRSTNAAIQRLRKKIAELLSMLGQIKEELSEPQSPKLVDILAAYYGQRNAGAWSSKAKAGNLKQYAETVNFLLEKKIYTVDNLEAYVSGISKKLDALKGKVNQAQSRSKEIRELLNFAEMYAETKPVYDQMNGIRFKKRRETYQQEHENELRRFYLARRKLKDHFSEDGKLPISNWRRELAGIENTVSHVSAEQKPLSEEWKKLISIEAGIQNTLRQMDYTPRKNREQER